MNQKEKKSVKKDFKNLNQYISATKNPNIKTEFDDLPRIKNHELDHAETDENPVKKNWKKWELKSVHWK